MSISMLFVSTIGSLSMIADSPFAQGELWAPQVATVNGNNVFTGTPLGTSSSAVASDGVGGVAFDTNRYVLSQVTFPLNPNGVSPPLFPPPTAGPIFPSVYNFNSVFISSSSQFSDGTPADFLNIGTANGSVRFQSNVDDITIMGHRDVEITNASITAAVDALIIAQRDMTLTNATVFATQNVDLVVDNDFPASPLIGPGAFNMDATSTISANTGYIRVYTALQNLNSIDPAAQFISAGNPNLFTPGTLYVDTDQEQWCTYYPNGSLGVPFRIFYKDCLQIAAEEAEIIVSEFLFQYDMLDYDLNQYYGWPSRFIVFYDLYQDRDSTQFDEYENRLPEKYFIRKPRSLFHDPRGAARIGEGMSILR